MEARTVDEWVDCYRSEFGLPVRERGGFVMLPITGSLCVVHLPTARAERVHTVLSERGSAGPMLARQIRWSLLAHPDSRPGERLAAELTRLDIAVPAVGSAVMLPTSLGRWSREGCHWVRPPSRDDVLPELSLVLDAALAVGQRVAAAATHSGGRGKLRWDRDGVGPR
ncbi:hypothetical protein ACWEVD_22350 [Nocardia thailandica]|uniref:DNA-binding protein n=1 Tax=Nocardia thailandica TaxID=257275 RepID=A0ABW6PWJ1_9NOCA|nr:hypothetical protein [Nocardia thailandica]